MQRVTISLRDDVLADLEAEMEAMQVKNRSEFIESLIKKGLYPYKVRRTENGQSKQ